MLEVSFSHKLRASTILRMAEREPRACPPACLLHGLHKKTGAEAPACKRTLFNQKAQSNLPMATAVSDMRLEKPHSLSYQERTDTKVPSMTLV